MVRTLALKDCYTIQRCERYVVHWLKSFHKSNPGLVYIYDDLNHITQIVDFTHHLNCERTIIWFISRTFANLSSLISIQIYCLQLGMVLNESLSMFPE